MKKRVRKIRIPAAAAKRNERKNALFLTAVGVLLILIVFVVAYIFLFSSGPGNGALNSGISGLTDLFQNNQVLTLSPAEVTKASVVRLTVKGLEASAKFEWTIDGTPVTPADPMVMTLSEEAWAKKGSVVKVRAVGGDKEYVSNEVVIANSPAEVTGVGFADQPNANDPLMVRAEARDIDEDEIRYEYAWIVNGAPAGATDRLDSKVKRGDRIVVQVTACDSEGGCSSRSAEQTINNMPPVIAENKTYGFENNLFEYQVSASDPDGDTLTYALESSPPGSQIDPANGLIRWQVPQGTSETHRLSIVVTDGQGGRSTYDLNFTP